MIIIVIIIDVIRPDFVHVSYHLLLAWKFIFVFLTKSGLVDYDERVVNVNRLWPSIWGKWLEEERGSTQIG